MYYIWNNCCYSYFLFPYRIYFLHTHTPYTHLIEMMFQVSHKDGFFSVSLKSPFILFKKLLQKDQVVYIGTWNLRDFRGRSKKHIQLIGTGSSGLKTYKWQIASHEVKTHLYNERNCQNSKTTLHIVGSNVHHLYIWQRTTLKD